MTAHFELIERPDWMDDAACRGMDTRLFFPGRGEVIAAARAVCRRCDVQAECLAYALNGTGRADFGVWGGTTERQRHVLRRQLTTKTAGGAA